MLAITWGGANWAVIVTAGATVLIAAGVVVAGYQLRETRRARDAQIARDIAAQWHSPEMTRARADVQRIIRGCSTAEATVRLIKAYTKARKERGLPYFVFARYLDFFEEIGVAYRQDSHGLDLVDELLGDTIIREWQRWEPVIIAVYDDRPRTYANFRALARRLKARRKN